MADGAEKVLNLFENASFQSQAFRLSSLIFPAVYLIVMVLIGIKQIDFEKQKNIFKNRWLYILFLLSIAFLFAKAYLFDGVVLGFNGLAYAPLIPFLSLIPIVLAVGMVGPLASLGLAVLTGIGQIFIFGQDLSVLLFYPAMSLTFTVLLNETPQDTTNWRVGVSKLLESAMLSLVFWMLWQFNLAFVHGLRDVIAILVQAILLWVCHLPEVVLSALSLGLIVYYLPEEWKPKEFLKVQTANNVFGTAIEQIDQMTSGNFEEEYPLPVKTESEKAILDAIEKLRQSLRLRNDTQKRLLSLDPTHYSREGYDLVMSSILRAALTNEASSARIVLLEESSINRKPEMRLRSGQGEQTRNYAYLDHLILEKIGDEEQLVLSNIKIDQAFGLTPGTPYPQAIIALKLSSGSKTEGILWVGFEENRWISDEELNLYKELAWRASATLKTKEQISQVQTEKNWLNEVLNSIPDPILVVDSNGMVLYQNLASQDILQGSEGFINETNRGKQFVQARLLELTQNSKAVRGREKTISLANEREYSVDLYPVKLEGTESGSIIYLKDYHWINQANQEKNQFVSNISHDLRSPLKLMKGYTSIIRNIGNLSSQQNLFLDRLDSNIEDMRRLVNKVLDMERLDGGNGLMYTTFDIKELVNETIGMLAVQAQQKKIAVNTDFGSIKTPYISADRILIQQAIFNLLENSIKFSPRGETVLIKAEKDASWLHLTVQDHGKGIAPLDQSRIFDRFFFMDDGQNMDTRGQGLGLSIVKSIAEKHGGSVNVESKLGSGSIFYLDIPLHRLEGLQKPS